MLLAEHARHYRPLDSDQSAIGHRGSGCDAQRLPCQAAFPEKVTGAKHSDNSFLTLFGCDSQLYFAFPEVKDGIRRLPLPEDFSFCTILDSSVTAGDFGEDRFPIDRQNLLSFHSSTPMECMVACRAHFKPETVIINGFRTVNIPSLSCPKMKELCVQYCTPYRGVVRSRRG